MRFEGLKDISYSRRPYHPERLDHIAKRTLQREHRRLKNLVVNGIIPDKYLRQALMIAPDGKDIPKAAKQQHLLHISRLNAVEKELVRRYLKYKLTATEQE